MPTPAGDVRAQFLSRIRRFQTLGIHSPGVFVFYTSEKRIMITAKRETDTDATPTGVLHRMLAWEPMSQETAVATAGAILDGQWSDVEVAALLTAIQMRGASIEELTGFAQAVRARAIRVPCDFPDAIDTCGTGGSGLNTVNVSTAAAIVAAAAGCRVAKHGNRSISSRSGSSDVVSALGIHLDLDSLAAAERLEADGISFLHAPNFHPGLRRIADVRNALGFRTIFNLVGPLANPARVRRQLVGVYCGALLRDIVETLKRLGSLRILAVHGEDGADEITLTGATTVCELRNHRIREYQIEPEDFGLTRCSADAIRGAEAADNAVAIRRAFENHDSPVRDFILINAGAAIYVAGVTQSIGEGVSLARETLRSGIALSKLNDLRTLPTQARRGKESRR